jgi:hypothetical protein
MRNEETGYKRLLDQLQLEEFPKPREVIMTEELFLFLEERTRELHGTNQEVLFYLLGTPNGIAIEIFEIGTSINTNVVKAHGALIKKLESYKERGLVILADFHNHPHVGWANINSDGSMPDEFDLTPTPQDIRAIINDFREISSNGYPPFSSIIGGISNGKFIINAFHANRGPSMAEEDALYTSPIKSTIHQSGIVAIEEYLPNPSGTIESGLITLLNNTFVVSAENFRVIPNSLAEVL